MRGGDGDIIAELWDAIANSPYDVELKAVLMEQYLQMGPEWRDTATEIASQILQMHPDHQEAKRIAFQQGTRQKPTQSNRQSKTRSTPSSPRVTNRSSTEGAPAVRPIVPLHLPENDILGLEDQFKRGIRRIQQNSKLLHEDAQALSAIPVEWEGWEEHIANLQALTEGRFNAVVTGSPCSVRELARDIQNRKEEAVDVATDDFNDYVLWLERVEKVTSDKGIRDRLMRRARALQSALTKDLEWVASAAMMHAEHEGMEREYENDETMLGDTIAEIPRENFWVSDDNYAWNMSELAQALTTQGGVRVNPLTGKLFSKDDVESIVRHPLAGGLAEVQLEQESLAQGVRAKTIEQMEVLSAVLLADQSEDQAPTRLALDVFQQHVAGLPSYEKEALSKLRIPAVDSHTGQQFTSSVGETVDDAIANRICAHKTGDLVGQAAIYLKGFTQY